MIWGSRHWLGSSHSTYSQGKDIGGKDLCAETLGQVLPSRNKWSRRCPVPQQAGNQTISAWARNRASQTALKLKVQYHKASPLSTSTDPADSTATQQLDQAPGPLRNLYGSRISCARDKIRLETSLANLEPRISRTSEFACLVQNNDFDLLFITCF